MRRNPVARVLSATAALLAFGAIGLLALSADGAGEKWAKRFNGPGSFNDYANAIAMDGSGNIYVTGESPGTSTNRDVATVKYNSAGKQLWVKTHHGPGAYDDAGTAIAVDASGNVYVAGYVTSENPGLDFVTIKYSSAGKELWVQYYDGPVGGKDVARAIAVDAAGNVYVTGESLGKNTSRDIATVKYDKLGQRRWAKRYNGPGNGDDAPSGIAVDKAGNVYVSGFSRGSGTGDDYVVLKY